MTNTIISSGVKYVSHNETLLAENRVVIITEKEWHICISYHILCFFLCIYLILNNGILLFAPVLVFKGIEVGYSSLSDLNLNGKYEPNCYTYS